MKNFVIILLACAVLLGYTSALYAAKDTGEKLTRGVANVLSGVLEVPKTIGEEWKASNNAFVGVVAGTFKGLAWWIARTGSGLWDVVTFPFPLPSNYDPLFKPDYVWRDTTSDFKTTQDAGVRSANRTVEATEKAEKVK